jgi:hypothetical protein
MLEQDKDEISRFFRKAARSPHIRFVESDWKKLEAKLDVAADTAATLRFRKQAVIISIVSLLFVGTGSFLFFSGLHNTSAITRKSTVNTIVNQSAARPVTPKDEKDRSEVQVMQSATKTLEQNAVLPSQLSASQEKVITTKKEQHMSGAPAIKFEHTATTTTQQKSKTEGEITLPENTSKAEKINIPLKEMSANEIATSPVPIDSTVVAGNIMGNKIEVHDSLPATKESLQQSRWSIMLTLSPDFSSTGLNKFTRPGEAIGVAAYYRINNAFSISAGVVKSNKMYWDNGSAYKPAEAGFWAKKTNGVVPGKVEGNCGILEIPLGFQYDFSHNEKSRIYMSATFTSYFMFRESYRYIFNSSNPGAIDHWDVKKKTFSPFSIATYAVGYERRISDRMMIGFSPYIKIPISGIGAWASVKLYSIGGGFTVRYQFQKKKQPERLMPSRSSD